MIDTFADIDAASARAISTPFEIIGMQTRLTVFSISVDADVMSSKIGLSGS